MYTQGAKRPVHVPGCTHRALSALFVYTALFKAPVLRYTPAKRSSLSALTPPPAQGEATPSTLAPLRTNARPPSLDDDDGTLPPTRATAEIDRTAHSAASGRDDIGRTRITRDHSGAPSFFGDTPEKNDEPHPAMMLHAADASDDESARSTPPTTAPAESQEAHTTTGVDRPGVPEHKGGDDDDAAVEHDDADDDQPKV